MHHYWLRGVIVAILVVFFFQLFTGFIMAQSSPAYFLFEDYPGGSPFVIELTDPIQIQTARTDLYNQQKNASYNPLHISGNIIKQPVWYNPPWHFYLNPQSIIFFQNAVEVCDSTIHGIEANLGAVCGAFLPNCNWCPWGSRLVKEIASTDLDRDSDTDFVDLWFYVKQSSFSVFIFNDFLQAIPQI